MHYMDTHAHLDMDPLCNDIDGVLQRAESNEVKNIISVGTDLAASKAALKIAKSYEPVYVACGVHPHDAKNFKHEKKGLSELLNEEKVCAVGETGLDFFYEHSTREEQIYAFKAQLDMASKADLPVIIHSRDAGDTLLEILEDYHNIRAVVHCFSENIDIANWLLSKDIYVSFTGILTFKNSASYLPVVEKIPVESIMLESDSPFLAPVPKRGKPNEPSYLVHTARKLADIKKLSEGDIARITTFNARRLFTRIRSNEEKPQIAYPIRNSLYLNLTTECTDACVFCVRYYTDFVKGHNLRLTREPTSGELIEKAKSMTGYKEVVFCGYGEPTLRLDVIKEVAAAIKKFDSPPLTRIDTNGHGNLIYNRNILPELKGLIDAVSVSLKAETAEKYFKVCRPKFGIKTYEKIKEFVIEAKKHIPSVSVTAVNLPSIDLKKCEKIATEELGVPFRVRQYNIVG